MATLLANQVRSGFSRLLVLPLLALAFLAAPSPPERASPLPSFAPKTLLQFTSQGHVLGFQPGGFYLSNGTYALRIEFVDAHPVAPAGDSASTDSGSGAPPLGEVTYPHLWDGISLTYDASHGLASSTYRLEPQADVHAIQLRYNAPVALNSDGTLSIEYATGQMTESAPVAWQERAGERVPVSVAFEFRAEREIGFAVGEYDVSRPLFIDPTLTWNTFLGGSGYDPVWAVAVDGNRNVYVAGASAATWGEPVRAFSGGWNDAFAAKLGSRGQLLWNTFLGGSGADSGFGLVVDGDGYVYVAGSSDATWGSPALPFAGGGDAFVAKLDSAGELTGHSFLGGSGIDSGYAAAIDGDGNIYVAGTSTSTWGSPVRAYTASSDAFVAKLSASGDLTWNTFLGGSEADWGNAVAIAVNGNVYIAGYSYATWAWPLRAYGGDRDAFVARLSSSGALTWNTFLGGSGEDDGRGVAVDGDGNVYVAGYSPTTWGSPVRAYTASNDAFAAKLSASGALTWNTFLGGSGNDLGWALAVDGNRYLYIAGHSNATWGLPVRAYTGGYDALVAKMDGMFHLYLPLLMR